MPCETFDLEDGGRAIICTKTSGKRRQWCAICRKARTTKLCDFPINDRGATCDQDLCDGCAVKVTDQGSEVEDICPAHDGYVKRLGWPSAPVAPAPAAALPEPPPVTPSAPSPSIPSPPAAAEPSQLSLFT